MDDSLDTARGAAGMNNAEPWRDEGLLQLGPATRITSLTLRACFDPVAFPSLAL